MTSLNRRRFIGAAIGTGAAGRDGGVVGAGRRAPTAARRDRSRGVPNSRIGIQLYTMREKMGGDANRANVRRVLNRLGRQRLQRGRARRLRRASPRSSSARWLDNAGLRAVSGHDGVNIDPANTTWQSEYQQTLENANIMGQQYTGLALVPRAVRRRELLVVPRPADERGGGAGQGGRAAVLLPQPQLRVREQAGATARRSSTSCSRRPTRELVKFELDLYWIIRGGAEPARVPARDHAAGTSPTTSRTARGATGRAQEDFEDVGPGRDRLPGHLRRGRPPRRQALLRRARRAVAVAPRRREAEFKHRAQPGVDVPAERALLASRDGRARRYRWRLVVPGRQRPAGEVDAVDPRALRRSKSVMPVLAWPASHSGRAGARARSRRGTASARGRSAGSRSA